MCFPGYSKTCMPTVRQIVDCLVAARPMPIRCGPCLSAKHINHATKNCSNCDDNVHIFNNLKILHDNDKDNIKKTVKTKYRKNSHSIDSLEVSLKVRI